MLIVLLFMAACFSLASIARKFRHRKRPIALANAGGPALGLMSPDGRKTFLLDSGVSLPVAARWLLYELKTDANHVTTALGVNRPIGPSPDSPSGTISGAALELSVYINGVVPRTVLGIAHSAITAGDTLVASTVGGASAGQIDDLTTLGAGTYWIVGYALETVAAGAEFAYAPCFPFKVNQATNAVTMTAAGN